MIFAGNMLYAYKIDKPLNLSLILYDTCNICANIWRSSQSMMETFIQWYYTWNDNILYMYKEI